MSHASGKNCFSGSSHYRDCIQASAGDNDALMQLLVQPGKKEEILADMAAFEPIGQGMMGENYRNDKGNIVPKWMLNGDNIFVFTDTCAPLLFAPLVGRIVESQSDCRLDRRYEPGTDAMIPTIAAATGRAPLEVCWDLLLQTDAPHGGVLWRPLFEYKGNSDDIVESLQLPNMIPGFDDAGAHCTILTDATCATTNVQYCKKTCDLLCVR